MNIECIIKEAGRKLKNEYLETPLVSVKERYDLVSQSDKRIEEELIKEIIKLFPNDDIYSEEIGEIKNEGRSRWIIDPIDGTADFIFGVPYFAISIAKEVDGIIEEGYVYNPISEEFYKSIKNERKSYLNDVEIKVSEKNVIEESLIAFGFSANEENMNLYLSEWSNLMNDCRKAMPLITPALTICNVARGRIDAYIDFGSSMEGKAAASMILLNAGGSIRNYYREGFDHREKGHICSNGRLDLEEGRG